MNNPNPSPLNLLTLPPLQRKIMVHLAREGSADASHLAEALNEDPLKIEQELHGAGSQGQHTAFCRRSGQRQSRPYPPPHLTGPSLARAAGQQPPLFDPRNCHFQYGRAHPAVRQGQDERVCRSWTRPRFAREIFRDPVSLAWSTSAAAEQHLLRAACLFHDVGNVVDRDRHHIISEETIQRLTATGKLPFSTREAELVGLLCRWHRKDYDPQRVDQLQNETVRTGLMASILRVADAMDIDHRRSDYNERFSEVLEFFYPLRDAFLDQPGGNLGRAYSMPARRQFAGPGQPRTAGQYAVQYVAQRSGADAAALDGRTGGCVQGKSRR